MKVYKVTYVTSNYSNDRSEKIVVSTSATKAALEVSKKRYTRSSGRVTDVVELFDSAVIAK
jgi:hypothetical protein